MTRNDYAELPWMTTTDWLRVKNVPHELDAGPRKRVSVTVSRGDAVALHSPANSPAPVAVLTVSDEYEITVPTTFKSSGVTILRVTTTRTYVPR